jgi:hypothetical protein
MKPIDRFWHVGIRAISTTRYMEACDYAGSQPEERQIVPICTLVSSLIKIDGVADNESSLLLLSRDWLGFLRALLWLGGPGAGGGP